MVFQVDSFSDPISVASRSTTGRLVKRDVMARVRRAQIGGGTRKLFDAEERKSGGTRNRRITDASRSSRNVRQIAGTRPTRPDYGLRGIPCHRLQFLIPWPASSFSSCDSEGFDPFLCDDEEAAAEDNCASQSERTNRSPIVANKGVCEGVGNRRIGVFEGLKGRRAKPRGRCVEKRVRNSEGLLHSETEFTPCEASSRGQP